MKIVGTGFIAGHLEQLTHRFPDTVVMAAGVADSACSDEREFLRERQLLERTIEENPQCRIVYFSSAGRVYGDWDGWRDERTACHPQSHYGRHNLECENLIRESDCRHLIVRLPNLVGPKQNPAQLIPALVRQIKSGHVRVFEDATRDLLGIGQLQSILEELIPAAPDRASIVVASGISTPVGIIVQHLATMLGISPTLNVVPGGTVERFRIDRLRELAPESTRFDDGYHEDLLRQCVAEMSENGSSNGL